MAERVVELRGISKSWGAVRALVNVDATFATGVCHAVLGANGSGKSTLLALVATLATPTSGTLAHRGFGADRTAIRASLGWLGHDALCYPELTGRENLQFAASLYGCGAADVDAACTRFGVGNFADRPFRTGSRGQRQRIALARALVHRPSLLLLDEPTTGLDDAGVDRLAAVVEEEVAAGTLVLLVTHDAPFVARVSGKALRLERGRVVS